MTDRPSRIEIPIGNGASKTLVKLADGSYAERYAAAAGAGLVTDHTGQYTFDLGSLASKPEYDTDFNQVAITYGPDREGRYVKQTSTWGPNNLWLGDSAWTVVDADGNSVE
jgi:hypothetical protein